MQAAMQAAVADDAKGGGRAAGAALAFGKIGKRGKRQRATAEATSAAGGTESMHPTGENDAGEEKKVSQNEVETKAETASDHASGTGAEEKQKQSSGKEGSEERKSGRQKTLSKAKNKRKKKPDTK